MLTKHQSNVVGKTSHLIKTLLQANLITQEKFTALLEAQKYSGKSIPELLVSMGFVEEKELIKALSEVFDIPAVNLEKESIDPAAIKMLPYEVAKRHSVFPLRKEKNYLILATANPQDIIILDDVRCLSGLQIKLALSPKSEIDKVIEKYYQPFQNSLNELFENIKEDAVIDKINEEEEALTREAFDIREVNSNSSTVVKLVNLILSEGVKSRATDIHIEPQEKFVDVKYRIDGVLRSITKVQNNLLPNLMARIKILTDLDIAETRKPQDGRARIMVNSRKIDLRISTIPTFYGEKAVLRVLDKQEAKVELSQIGFKGAELNLFIQSICRPQGIILATGPTSSGKTSTLYSALNFIRKSEVKNIVTIEDPVEYLMEGVNQIQVNLAKDVTFANGLKSILRQDPNVILVGEIRDKETAEIAFRSSLTGHLVLSTLHTNNAIATITRLLDIGLAPYLIASSLILVISQRLIRLNCKNCNKEYIPEPHTLNIFKDYIEKFNIHKFYRGKGCDACDSTGYFGRAAVFEMLSVNARIKYLISRKSPEDVIYREAESNGFKPLIDSAMHKVREGQTSLEEIARVIDMEDLGNLPGRTAPAEDIIEQFNKEDRDSEFLKGQDLNEN